MLKNTKLYFTFHLIFSLANCTTTNCSMRQIVCCKLSDDELSAVNCRCVDLFKHHFYYFFSQSYINKKLRKICNFYKYLIVLHENLREIKELICEINYEKPKKIKIKTWRGRELRKRKTENDKREAEGKL